MSTFDKLLFNRFAFINLPMLLGQYKKDVLKALANPWCRLSKLFFKRGKVTSTFLAINLKFLALFVNFNKFHHISQGVHPKPVFHHQFFSSRLIEMKAVPVLLVEKFSNRCTEKKVLQQLKLLKELSCGKTVVGKFIFFTFLLLLFFKTNLSL